MSDYFNLLQDSLRSAHLQVEKIYKRLQTMDPSLYVNVRTGYSMKYRSHNTNYVFSSGRYPLCWNSEAVGQEYNPIVIERLLNKYEDWIDEYGNSMDNLKIKKLIQNEIDKAKSEPDLERKIRYTLLDYYDEIDHEEQDEIEDSQNSFIMNDDEVIGSDGKKRRIFKKRLGKRPVNGYENINQIPTSTTSSSSKKRKKLNFKSLYEDSIFKEIKFEDEQFNKNDEYQDEYENFTHKKRLRNSNKKIINDEDEEENQE
jgi:hypothetical protein